MTDEGMNKLKDLRKEYELLAKYNGGEDYIAFKVLDMAVKELSTSEIPNKWIPVSERLPEEENKSYWICTDNGYQCECRWTNINHIWTNLTRDWHWHLMDIPPYSKVVAWMPLLEPYLSENPTGSESEDTE